MMLPEKIEGVHFVSRNTLIIRMYAFCFLNSVALPLTKS